MTSPDPFLSGRRVRKVGGSSPEPVLSCVAGPKALLQHPGWRNGDRSQRMGPRSHPLWEWRPDAVRPGRRGWPLMTPYDEWLGGGTVCPLCRGVASSEAEMVYLLEGRSATLE